MGGFQGQGFALGRIEPGEVDTQGVTQALPEAGRHLGGSNGRCRRLGWGHQLRQGQAVPLDGRVVVGLAQGFGRGLEQPVEVVPVGFFFLVEARQGVELEEGVIGDDAAGRGRPPDVLQWYVLGGHQAGLDVEAAHAEHRAVLDGVGLALGQVGPRVLETDAVAAGVGEEVAPVAVAHAGVAVGQVALLVGDHPVAIFGTAEAAACAEEASATGGGRDELLGTNDF